MGTDAATAATADPTSNSQIAKRAVRQAKKAKQAGGRPPFATIKVYIAAIKEIREAIRLRLTVATGPDGAPMTGAPTVNVMSHVDLALDILIILDKHGITLGDLAALLPIVKQLVD